MLSKAKSTRTTISSRVVEHLVTNDDIGQFTYTGLIDRMMADPSIVPPIEKHDRAAVKVKIKELVKLGCVERVGTTISSNGHKSLVFEVVDMSEALYHTRHRMDYNYDRKSGWSMKDVYRPDPRVGLPALPLTTPVSEKEHAMELPPVADTPVVGNGTTVVVDNNTTIITKPKSISDVLHNQRVRATLTTRENFSNAKDELFNVVETVKDIINRAFDKQQRDNEDIMKIAGQEMASCAKGLSDYTSTELLTELQRREDERDVSKAC